MDMSKRTLTLWLSREEHLIVRKAAAEHGKTMSSYVREILIREAKKTIEKAREIK